MNKFLILLITVVGFSSLIGCDSSDSSSSASSAKDAEIAALKNCLHDPTQTCQNNEWAKANPYAAQTLAAQQQAALAKGQVVTVTGTGSTVTAPAVLPAVLVATPTTTTVASTTSNSATTATTNGSATTASSGGSSGSQQYNVSSGGTATTASITPTSSGSYTVQVDNSPLDNARQPSSYTIDAAQGAAPQTTVAH